MNVMEVVDDEVEVDDEQPNQIHQKKNRNQLIL
jgi:hypothetical protein